MLRRITSHWIFLLFIKINYNKIDFTIININIYFFILKGYYNIIRAILYKKIKTKMFFVHNFFMLSANDINIKDT